MLCVTHSEFYQTKGLDWHGVPLERSGYVVVCVCVCVFRLCICVCVCVVVV